MARNFITPAHIRFPSPTPPERETPFTLDLFMDFFKIGRFSGDSISPVPQQR
jgi:hypothetical protein